jgi:8-oxo-dGTP diphosphatase
MSGRIGFGPSPAELRLTVDVVIFTIREGTLQVLLVRRGIEPFLGAWAIPGGFVVEDESLEQAARRELREETGVDRVYLEQLYTFGDPGRDARGRVVTVAYFALVPGDDALRAGTDAADARWWPMDGLPAPLAFDHPAILQLALARLRGKLDYGPVGFELLGERFTLSELQSVHEAILGRPLDKRNFRKRMDAHPDLRPLDQWRRPAAGRPARLYRVDHDRPDRTGRMGKA